MAVLGRLLISSAERLDLQDLLSIDSYTAGDLKYLIKSFIGDSRPYILRGFDIIDPNSAIGSASCAIRVANSVVYYPGSKAGSFFYGLEEGHPQAAPLVPELRKNAVNYVYLTFSTFNTSVDNRSFWDPDKDGGVGGEFSQDVNTESVLKVEVNVSTGSFPANTIPIAKIKVGPAVIQEIEDARDLMFRLGSGGLTPDPFNSYTWKSLPSPSFQRVEPPTKLTSSVGPNPFYGADKNIFTLKEWMDAVMTEIKVMKGSAYWYSNGSTLIPGVNLSNVWSDALGMTITGVGKFVHSDSTPGLLSWTSPIYIRSIIGNLTYQIDPGSATLNQGQVAYIQLVRNEDFQPTNIFTFTNGSTSVTASIAVSGISVGDWIKLESDDISKWAKVVAVSSTSITLSSPYAGTSSTGKAVRAQGTYTVNVANPEAVPVNADVYWLAKRSDNYIVTATIESPANSGATRTGDLATITTTAPHGLVAGQTVSISGVSISSFDSVVEIFDVPTSTTFRYYNPGPDVPAGIAGGGTVSGRAKIYLRAIGELVQGEERQLDDNAVLNVLTFVGSESETDTTPPYTILPNSLSPYTFSTNNNLTQAISSITGNVNSIFTTLDQPSYDETIEIVAPPAPTAFVTQSSGGADESIQSGAEGIGQSFTATSDSFLTRVDVSLRAVGAPDATIHCDVYTDNAGQPGTLLGSSISNVSSSSLTASYATYQFNLPPIHLTSSFVYWIVLRVSGVVTLSSTDYIQAQVSTLNPYTGGNASKYNGTSWVASPSNDLVFTAYNIVLGPNQWPPIPANSLITIPKNSRLIGSPQQSYIVGKGTLELYLNGQFLRLNAVNSWQEVGTPLSNSSVVRILQDLEPGDELTFRLDATGGPGSGGGSAPDDNFVVLSTEPSADNADYVLIYDVSASAYKKQTRANFLSGISRIRTVDTFSSNGNLTSSHDHVRVDCSSGAVTLNLPPAALNIGLQYTIKKIDSTSNSVIINGGTDLIDGSSTLSFNIPNQSFTIVAADSGAWDIV